MKMKIWGMLMLSGISGAALMQPALGQTEAGAIAMEEASAMHRDRIPLRGRMHMRRAGDTDVSSGRIVDRLDSDGDGKASETEFVAARMQLTDRFFEQKDANQDGLISADENEAFRSPRREHFFHPRRPGFERAEVGECVRETISDFSSGLELAENMRFDNADTDGDGMLSLPEVSAAREARSHELFGRLDTDDDGFVTSAELGEMLEGQPGLHQVVVRCNRKDAND